MAVPIERETDVAPYTVFSSWTLRERITELALPDNPGGVVWLGRFDFRRSGMSQRVILWSPTPHPKTAIAHFPVNVSPEHEVVVVGDIRFVCTDIYGFIRYPSPKFRDRLGKPFSEAWVTARQATKRYPVKFRHVDTLDEARALPPPTGGR